MTTCEVCRAPVVDPSRSPSIMSRAGIGQVRVKQFCSKRCQSSFITNLRAVGVCAWCGQLARGPNVQHGGLGEPYCGESCFSEAGRAMFAFYAR